MSHLTSPNTLLQTCSLKIVQHYVEKSNAGYKFRMLATTALASLLALMADGSPEIAYAAENCFTVLVAAEESNDNFKDDPFTRISNKWTFEDKKRIEREAQAAKARKVSLGKSSQLGSRGSMLGGSMIGSRYGLDKGKSSQLGSRSSILGGSPMGSRSGLNRGSFEALNRDSRANSILRLKADGSSRSKTNLSKV